MQMYENIKPMLGIVWTDSLLQYLNTNLMYMYLCIKTLTSTSYINAFFKFPKMITVVAFDAKLFKQLPFAAWSKNYLI